MISNDETRDIIDKQIIPQFRKAAYYKGTLNGLNAIITKLNSKIKL